MQLLQVAYLYRLISERISHKYIFEAGPCAQ